MGTTSIRILNEREVRSLIDPSTALAAVREAFAKLARKEVTLPEVLETRLP